MADADELEQKIATAHDLFQDRSQWIPAHKRIAILEKREL